MGARRNHLSMTSIVSWAMPDWNMISPMSMNMGVGARVKVKRGLST